VHRPAPASCLATIDANLFINANPALASLHGLENLVSVGAWLQVVNNPLLADVNGLAGLESAGGPAHPAQSAPDERGRPGSPGDVGATVLDIGYNAALTDIDGLSRLTTVEGEIHIRSNPVLTDIEG